MLYQSCTILCLQLIWSQTVVSANACLCWASKMIIYDQPKNIPYMKYILIKLPRRVSKIAVIRLRNPNMTESSTSQRWVLQLPPKLQSVPVTKWRLCRSRFFGTLFLPPISVYVYTLVWVCGDYKTLNKALLCSPVLVAAMLGGGRLQSSTSVGPL